MAIKAVSVSQLNAYIKRLMASDPILMRAYVSGEIANLTRHSSGHWYFSLKDDQSSIRCFLPRDKVVTLRFELDEGIKINASGSVSVFERNGSYSFNIRDIDIQGEGELKKAFDLLMQRLNAEGLFAEERKRTLPTFPKKIAVLTSPTGAAIRDIISTVKRRNPLVDILIYPCLVQGEGAAETVVSGIRLINESFPDTDIMIVGRGGGSMDELWTFNEESVARAVAASEIPVISAVGHERDYVISDYAADVRAATPTAAAELAVPDINYYKDILRICSPAKMFYLLSEQMETKQRRLRQAGLSADAAVESVLNAAAHRLSMLKLNIESFDPMRQLEKGYAIAKTECGTWVSGVKNLSEGSRIRLIMKDGELDCLVENIKEN